MMKIKYIYINLFITSLLISDTHINNNINEIENSIVKDYFVIKKCLTDLNNFYLSDEEILKFTTSEQYSYLIELYFSNDKKFYYEYLKDYRNLNCLK